MLEAQDRHRPGAQHELLLQVPEAAADEAASLLRDALQGTARWWAAGSRVRFVAEVSTGHSWAGAH